MLDIVSSLGFLLFVASLGAIYLFKVIVELRRVVSTNEVHIVQSSKETTSYGKDTKNGNTYYEWPSWFPVIGVTKIVLPVSVFDLDLDNYESYDKGRLPFRVDVKAFFRINDSNVAAQRVASFDELKEQLEAIVQGAVRTILAGNDIEEIMGGRSSFGDAFTKEVDEQLSNWGVETVKNIELMDIRDTQSSNVIQNIMAKKKSYIDMESRTEVAKNKKAAEIAEIEAKREVEMQQQEAQQIVGLRSIEANRAVNLSNEAMTQALMDQSKVTKEKEMQVLSVKATREAEIAREVQLINADKEKQTTVIKADADFEAATRQANSNLALGQAAAESEKAIQLAPIQAQITLAKEIGENASYQNYLITIRQVEAQQAVGIEQAKALEKASVKIIANTGNAPSGIQSVGELFSSKGGTAVGAMLEGLAQTGKGKSLLSKVGLDDEVELQ